MITYDNFKHLQTYTTTGVPGAVQNAVGHLQSKGHEILVIGIRHPQKAMEFEIEIGVDIEARQATATNVF